MELPSKGDLTDISLPKILISLSRRKVTGTLTIAAPPSRKTIYLREGKVIFASSTFEDDRLGEILVKAGKISMEQYDRSVELLKATGKRQGAILIEQGYITPRDFVWGIKYQVKEIIYSLFLLDSGEYEVAEVSVFPDDIVPLNMSIENLIYEGAKEISNLNRIRRELPDLATVLSLNDPTAVFKGIDLSVQDRTILSLVDGRRTIKQILDDAQMNSFEVMKTLYVLVTTGFIAEKSVSGTPSADTVDIEEIFDAVTSEEQDLRHEIEDLYVKLPTMSDAELLMVSEGSTDEEVKRNYYHMAKEFHPDRLYNLTDGDLKVKCTAIFDAITKAYNVLRNSVYRKTYFDSLGKTVRHQEDTRGALVEEQFRRGVEAFKEGNYWGAAEDFRFVTRSLPRHAKAWSYLSLSLSKIPKRTKEAEEAIREAIRLEPYNGEHYANLGVLYLKAGLKKRAQHQFERALRLDPGNSRAMQGIEELNQMQ